MRTCQANPFRLHTSSQAASMRATVALGLDAWGISITATVTREHDQDLRRFMGLCGCWERRWAATILGRCTSPHARLYTRLWSFERLFGENDRIHGGGAPSVPHDARRSSAPRLSVVGSRAGADNHGRRPAAAFAQRHRLAAPNRRLNGYLSFVETERNGGPVHARRPACVWAACPLVHKGRSHRRVFGGRSATPDLRVAGTGVHRSWQSVPPSRGQTVEPIHFEYTEAFSRNLGWVTESEQQALRQARVAIAGMGGVGGSHLLTLTRLGIGQFHLAEFDRFELPNFNRQAGASVSTIGRPKLDVMAERARDINPELEIETFPDGVKRTNVRAFLRDIDLFVDGIDFFAIDARRALFDGCRTLSIPALTAAPLGMGVAFLYFEPGKMTFEEYFGLNGQRDLEQYLRFFLGLAPQALQQHYLRDPSTIDLERRRGPSTAVGVELCAGVVGSAALKILLGRGEVPAAPHALQFDAYENRLVRTWRPGGYRNPIEWARRSLARSRLLAPRPAGSESGSDRHGTHAEQRPIAQILDLARWAPSPDNTQPWRFTVIDDQHVVVRTLMSDDRRVYDIHGRALRVALGGLLETIEIAASGLGQHAQWQMRDGSEQLPVVDVFFEDVAERRPHPLIPFIRERTTQRRPLSRRPLSAHAKREIEAAVTPPLELHWFEGSDRQRLASALSLAGKIRLEIPEAHGIHQRIIEWGARESSDRIPDQALGTDPLTTLLMRWALRSWSRAHFLNRFAAGTWIPRLELDFLPGVNCAAHFAIGWREAEASPNDEVEAGRALQRVWLTATRLGLRLQPEFAPLIFARYARQSTPFTRNSSAVTDASRLAAKLDAVMNPTIASRAIVLARLGYGRAPIARSLRLPLHRLSDQPYPNM